MENYKIRNALYVGDTVYTIGETIKLISKENKTITGKIFNFYEGQIVLTCENIFEPDGGFEYCLNDIKSIEKVSEKE
jgi:hypothetical protein